MLRMLVASLAMLAPTLASATAPAVSVLETGHTAVWYDPARNGEGWVLEVLSDSRATLTWYTYDEDGAPRWLVGVGDVVEDQLGRFLRVDEMFITTGGRFGAGFDPSAISRTRAGSATLRFIDCERGELQFVGLGQHLQVPVQRLSHTSGSGCGRIHGRPGKIVTADAGLTGSWYEPARDGEGMQLQWTSGDAALLTWYTYDDSGRQLWLIGAGERVGDRVEFPLLHSARGPRFGDAFDPDDLVLEPWGSAELLLDCDDGIARFSASREGFGDGQRVLTRLTDATARGCPWNRPALTELYSLTVTHLPGELYPRGIADDGTVFGSGNRVYRLQPGADDWEALGEQLVAGGGAVVSSPDGSRIIGGEPIQVEMNPQHSLVEWRAGSDWRKLPGLTLRSSVLLGASHDRGALVGTGRYGDEPAQTPWVWHANTGQVALDLPEAGIPSPWHASDDGRIVVGMALFPRAQGGFPVTQALVWRNGVPELLRDHHDAPLGPASTCNADCSLIFGGGQSEFFPEHPSAGEAWMRTPFGRIVYLGRLPGDFLRSSSFQPAVASADGTVVGGRYFTSGITVQGFIWTPHTGLVSIREALAAQGTPLHWDSMAVSAMNSRGDRLLLHTQQNGRHKLAVLALDARVAEVEAESNNNNNGEH